jgi:hypothetical protein
MRPEELLSLLEEFNAVNVFEHVARRATARCRPGAEQDTYYAWWQAAVQRWQALYAQLAPFAYAWNEEIRRYELEEE